jgi:TonB family protein
MKTLSHYETELDKLALSIVSAERFKPGTHDGIPSTVAITIEVGLQTCMKRVHGGDSTEANQLMLRSHPVQAIVVRSEQVAAYATPATNGTPGSYKVGGSMSAPVPLLQPQAEYSDYARKKGISGICLLGLIVDANGMPQNIHVIKSLEPSLDQNAIEAVKKYRFKPAIKDGTVPVPVVVNIEVNFRLSKKGWW